MAGDRYIIGFGNYAKNDDGIGLRIIEHIGDNDLAQGFEAVEVGNDGMQLLTYFTDETERILIVDCALMEKEPGSYMVFTPDDVQTKKEFGNVSTHEGDVLKLVEMGKQLGYPIPEISILAIEPESLDMEMQLSATLSNQMDTYVSVAIEEITK